MFKLVKTVEELRNVLREDVLEGARHLLGSTLVRGQKRARIIEVEAYRAEGDAGSHAFRGPTPRNRIMYGMPGLAYVYFNYGTHWMLNIVAHQEGMAAAVLIRAAIPIQGLEEMYLNRPKARRKEDLLSGPGKLAAAFEITRKDYGLDLLDPASPLHIIPGSDVSRIITGTRIGLAEGKGDKLPWRFIEAEAMRFASKPHPRSEPPL
jgi:DNA-3-methyladenine glycosylase